MCCKHECTTFNSFAGFTIITSVGLQVRVSFVIFFIQLLRYFGSLYENGSERILDYNYSEVTITASYETKLEQVDHFDVKLDGGESH